ncbi:putative bifunctional diguanylate cyclase/phosphodiesterase [Pseudoduganella aquatica]|uniref:putative bifunctional diguanylate cyclase/phosphodiesterase n=1 Tax=Pseudoduganella aquatica TaxID=2660641 RepID=UPI001E3A58CB|nr:EAL domain-containing protein [Pseudoduganella aquatica]
MKDMDPAYSLAASALLDALPEEIAVLGPDGSALAVNRAWRAHAGRHAAARSAEAHEGIEAVLAGAKARFETEYRLQTEEGERWFSICATPLDAEWRGAVVAHADITARRQSEAKLRIAAIAFDSPEGMMVTDAAGVILQVNQSFTRITGYTSAEVVGHKPCVLSSGRHDAEFYRAMWSAIGMHGRWQGEIWNRRKNGEVYPELLNIAAVRDAGGAVTHYVASLSDITLSKAASDEIKNLAFYDPLTHLPNRRMLVERLAQALPAAYTSGHCGALMLIDLDNFKTINETLGHSKGDMLLQQAAARLHACLRQGDTVARLGGDEFVVLIEGLSGQPREAAARSEALAAKLAAALNRPYTLGAHQCHSTPSIGITLFHAGLRQQPEELLMQADIAMYQAKEAGRNGMRFFDQSMQDSISERAQLERELRHAIDTQQFELYYQVQVDHLKHPLGAEALIRWIQPDGGAVSPARFIPLAEESGQILALGQWVLESACAQLRAWQSEPAMSELAVAVNVSARQFHQPDFCEQVRSVLRRYGVDPGLLKLELTEGVLLENMEDTIASMQALRELGVRFALDDFGTGYSSLQYLKRLPLDQLKIDQSFVRDLAIDGNDQAIVRTIIAMARSLNLDVIAEGVETDAQCALLGQLGCQSYQGYLFGKPMPAPALPELIRSGFLSAI